MIATCNLYIDWKLKITLTFPPTEVDRATRIELSLLRKYGRHRSLPTIKNGELLLVRTFIRERSAKADYDMAMKVLRGYKLVE